MRIIGGRASGIRLAVPDSNEIRPTEDRVKETMFSILGDLSGSCVVDLYSGTGALGLEALSRGASDVYLVERNSRHLAVMKKNIEAVCKSIGQEKCGRVNVISSDVRTAWMQLKHSGVMADIILADPPYDVVQGAFGGVELASSNDYASLAGENTIFVLECRTGTELPWFPEGPWRMIRCSTTGIRTVCFSRLASAFPEEESEDEI